jgi:1,4-alpha-glucan branching enzyme
VTFALESEGAREVFLCGDFNHWSPGCMPMIRRAESGRWEKRLTLPEGRYEYKFLVDGHWTTDPLSNEQVSNCFGSMNSVIHVKP